jgi:hypothetical protein
MAYERDEYISRVVMKAPAIQITVTQLLVAEGYLEINTYSAEEMVATLALPARAMRVAELLPRRSVTD